MDANDFSVVSSALDDYRRLIAAGKIQRWDVVKWGVTVDLALAAVSASLTPQTFVRSFALFVLAAAASLAAWFLMRHYNQRMTRARQDATHLVRMFKKNGIKFDELVGHDSEQAYAAGEAYDREELITFGAILAVAPLLVFVRYSIEKIL
jgi:hypothetical protein